MLTATEALKKAKVNKAAKDKLFDAARDYTVAMVIKEGLKQLIVAVDDSIQRGINNGLTSFRTSGTRVLKHDDQEILSFVLHSESFLKEWETQRPILRECPYPITCAKLKDQLEKHFERNGYFVEITFEDHDPEDVSIRYTYKVVFDETAAQKIKIRKEQRKLGME